MPRKGSKILEYWKDEIRQGIRYRTLYGKAKAWKTYKQMYRGNWDKSVVPVNILYSIGRAMISQIYPRLPRIAVSPTIPGYGASASVVEQIDNYLIRETSIKKEFKTMVLNCYLCGRAPGLIGYDSEFGYAPYFMSDEYEDASLTSFAKSGEKIEYNNDVKPGMPWFLSCSPEDFVVPWGTNRFEEAPWFAFRKMRKLKDVMEDPKYEHKKDLEGTYYSKLDVSTDTDPHKPTQSALIKPEGTDMWVELYEVHDKRSGRVFVLSFDHDKFLRDDFDFLQIEGLPAEVLGFNEDPDHFWWTPDAALIAIQQLELNDIRTMAKRHRRVGLLKVLYDRNLLKEDDITKLLDGNPKAAIGVDIGPEGDLRKATSLFQTHVPPDLIAAANEVREDTREIIGFSRNQMGAFEAPGGRRTAHEAELVRMAAQIRIDERRDQTTEVFERVIRKWNQIIFTQWTAPRVISIVGQDGARYWIKFTGDQVKSEYAYKVNPEDAIPSNLLTRKAELEKLMEIGTKIPGMDMSYLIQEYARHTDWLDPKRLLPQQGPGRNPEQAMDFNDFNKMQMSSNPRAASLMGE